MRTKEIDIDGQKYKIGALSFDQVEAYLAPMPENLETDDEKAKAYRTRAIEMICSGLNNGIPESNGNVQKGWDEARFRKECDYVVFNKLHDEILIFSGLKLETPKPELPGGV
jgi:hypothetical protein